MKPFNDQSQFRTLPLPESGSNRFNPSKSGYGVEIRRGRDINKRSSNFFISSGRWAEMPNDGIIDQEVSPAVLGELIDSLAFSSYNDQDERKTAEQVLVSDEIIQAQTIDFEPETDKDGRITVFFMRPRGYVSSEEIPIKTRGVKVTDETIFGYSNGISNNAFLDGGSSALGITREGFYGKQSQVTMTFSDNTIENGLGYQIDTGDYDSENQTGAFGSTLYSAEFGTDSIAFAGLLK
jgi:hypothetical protein